MPKVRSPIETWLLTVGTGGIYALLWVWEVGSELNEAEGTNVFKIYLWRAITFVLLLAIVVAVAITINSSNFIPAFSAFIIWGCFLIYVQVQIGNYIKRKNEELRLGLNFSNATSLALMYFAGMAGIAYIQSALNKVVLSEHWAS